MYKIEYREDKRNVPEGMPDYIKECINIKSLTIDLDDIKQISIVYDKVNVSLLGLYANVMRSVHSSSEPISSVVIMNSNNVNSQIIYEIINTDWMIDRNSSQEDLEDDLYHLKYKLERLQVVSSNKDNNNWHEALKELKITEYHINSINNFRNNHSKKGKQLIRK